MNGFFLKFVVRSLIGLNQILLKIAARVLPPEATVLKDVTAISTTMLLHLVAKRRIPDLVSDQRLSGAEIAKNLATDPGATHRCLRALVALGYFKMSRDGKFSNNRLSRALMSGNAGMLRGFAEYFGSESVVQSWAQLEETMRTGKSAFNRKYGMSVWAWFEKNPDHGTVFAEAMDGITKMDADFIAASRVFDVAKHICDVAGGRGTLLCEILKRHSGARGSIVESPRVLELARRYVDQKQLAGRVELVPGDLFDGPPEGVGHCDVFILKDILHDWNDVQAAHILKNTRAAMKSGAVLVIAESVVEISDLIMPGPIVDMQMMVCCDDGKQRSRAEFKILLESSGFRLNRIESLAAPIHLVIAEPV